MTDNVTVSTSGDFMLQDPTTTQVIEAYGSSTVHRSPWVDEQIRNGKLIEAGKPKAEPKEDDEPVRAAAPKGEVRGASKTKDPTAINRVKTS